jgi:ribose transport system substrate-binding protein
MRTKTSLFTSALSTLLCIATLGSSVLVGGCKSNGSSSGPRIAYITNGVASFWTIAKAGAEAAGRDLQTQVSVHMPAEGIADQKRIIEDLLIKGVDAIAISVIDAENQTALLNEAARSTRLITQDSDAPKSDRLAYIGMDNYEAGRLLGKLIKESLPNGGQIALFIGRVEQDNARKRRQGTIDEVLERTPDPSRYDPPGSPISNGTFTFLVTLTDQFDRVKAKANCEDAILRYPELDAVVGLFAYNTPACLEALKQTGKSGDIKVFSFDEADETLQAIKDGIAVGTIVQNPYEYGYRSVQMLKEVLSGNTAVIPQSKFVNIPAQRIDRSNVESYWADLRSKLNTK